MAKQVEKAQQTSLNEADQSSDWFVSAIVFDGSVRDSVNVVLGQLNRKADFITEMRDRICTEDGNIDRLTILGRQVKELENTLRFRLGMLTTDRPTAWFREAARRDLGPFRSTMLLAPVFSVYKTEQVQDVKKALYDAWTNAKEGPLPFVKPQESLWSILLGLRAKLEAMCVLGPKFGTLRLDQLPDALPTDLDCRSLRAFLINVRNEFRVVRDRMNVCFDQLWTASDKLWAAQLAGMEKQKQADKKQEETRAKFKFAEEEPQKEKKEQQQQQQTKQQRSGGRGFIPDFGLGFADMEALRFMGFKQKPQKEALRQRYIELAKKLHPDRNGGNEESFKLLNKAYNRLLQIV